METPPRDEAQEALLRDIIAEGSDAVSLFLNDTDVWKQLAMILMAPMT